MEVVDGFCIKSKIKTAILLSFYCDDAVFPSSFYKACFECEYGIYVHHTITILLVIKCNGLVIVRERHLIGWMVTNEHCCVLILIFDMAH